MIEPWHSIPSDEEIEAERQRRERQAANAKPHNVLPPTVAALKERCEMERSRVLDAMRGGAVFLPHSVDSFVAIVTGSASETLLPDFERLLDSAAVLGLDEALTVPSIPTTAREAIALLDTLIQWTTKQELARHSPPTKQTPTVEEREEAVGEYLHAHPSAKIKEVANAIGVSVGTVQKAQAWQSEMSRRRAQLPARVPLVRQLRNEGETSALTHSRCPEDSIVEDDANDAAWQRLVDAASPSERAKLHTLTPEKREELIALIREQNADERRSR